MLVAGRKGRRDGERVIYRVAGRVQTMSIYPIPRPRTRETHPIWFTDGRILAMAYSSSRYSGVSKLLTPIDLTNPSLTSCSICGQIFLTPPPASTARREWIRYESRYVRLSW